MEHIDAKTIISQYIENNQWFGINYNMNIYKGCCHGCIYCDSRSSCYGIEDFDRVRAKDNAVEIIRKELRGKRKKGVVGTGAMSDPYNPFEKRERLTRGALKQINNFNFGVAIATKSSLITRDIDILKKIKEHSPVLIKMTITTLDDELCSKIEPNVSLSSERFNAIKELSDNGIYTGVLLMPILPFINDDEENIIGIVKKAHECGAKFIFAYGMGVTLRENQRQHYYEKLIELFPEEKLAKKYIEIYENRYEYQSINSKTLWQCFKRECEKYNMLYKMEDIILSYKDINNKKEQISWF
ncbi:SPL family radical SAM protein [Clostridium gasigenes]|uniref:Radical SAM protein n=1 Tax=Clostridium gasigenes TaxID=94869 RepID=A0A7X0SAK3_9CLOT|nr:radical SAM protein [Clostridium gasigenes]MBB6714004.1 radical SAM protein [Clostridium gasigenes]MBU3087274.1 radical SAM protein [Clostridium gasigenes]